MAFIFYNMAEMLSDRISVWREELSGEILLNQLEKIEKSVRIPITSREANKFFNISFNCRRNLK